MAARVILVLVLILAPPALASADAIGGPCPAGQIYEENAVPPGAMHHSGGQCVADPSAPASASCSASPGAGSPAGLLVLALGLLLAGRARRRDRLSAP